MTPKQFEQVVRYYIDGIPNFPTSFSCVSPLRDERYASLNINFPKCVWYDFGAGVGGSGIELVSVFEGVDIATAKRMLDRILSGEAKDSGRYQYKKGLHTRKPLSGADFMLPSLGITEFTEEQYNQFPGKLKERGIDYATCKKYHWFIQNGSLIVPYTVESTETGLRTSCYKAISYDDYGRGQYGKKNIMTKGSSTLYPMSQLSSNRIVLCEGEYDVMALISHGFNAITGTAGCSTWRPEWSWALSGKNVTILYDNDDPGRKGATRVKDSLLPYVESVSISSFPIDKCKGYDVCDYFKEGGSCDGLYEQLRTGYYYPGKQSSCYDFNS